MNPVYLNYPNMQGNNHAFLVSDEQQVFTFPTDLLPLVKAHLRIIRSNTGEEALILQYIAAAIDAAEQYLQKDIVQRAIEIHWFGIGTLYLTRGKVTGLAAVTGDSPAQDVYSKLRVSGSMTFKGGGLVLMPTFMMLINLPWNDYWQTADTNNYRRVTFTSGFASIAEIPPAVISFILATVGMLYEVREFANVGERGSREYTMSIMPTFLLDAYVTQVLA